MYNQSRAGSANKWSWTSRTHSGDRSTTLSLLSSELIKKIVLKQWRTRGFSVKSSRILLVLTHPNDDLSNWKQGPSARGGAQLLGSNNLFSSLGIAGVPLSRNPAAWRLLQRAERREYKTLETPWLSPFLHFRVLLSLKSRYCWIPSTFRWLSLRRVIPCFLLLLRKSFDHRDYTSDLQNYSLRRAIRTVIDVPINIPTPRQPLAYDQKMKASLCTNLILL